jgi:hypothetical protein
MPRNRIIYNTQGLYFAPYSGEQNPVDDYYYLSGYQILKRLEKIQNFNYSIDQSRIGLVGFGANKSIFRNDLNSPTVNFTFSYIPDGVTNENRLNFDVANYQSANQPVMFSGLCKDNSITDEKDFYLVINKNEDDLYGNYILTDYYTNPTGVNDIIDPKSNNYAVLNFQNCYLTDYNFRVQVDSMPTVTQSYISDNINFYISGSGINYTILDLKSGINQPQNDQIIIPKALDLNQSGISGQNTLLPGDASVTFYRNPTNSSTNISSLIPENITPVTMSKVGNVFTKIAGITWGDAQAYSSIGYNNNMYVEVSPNQTTAGAMFGLSNNPTGSAGYDTINYAWHTSAPGTYNIYETGLLIASFGTYTISTKFRIEYNGKTVTYFKDGVSVRSVDVPIPNTTYYFDSSFNQVGGAITANYGILSNIEYYNDTIQSLEYSLAFQRNTLRSLNYKFPLGRKISFPVNGKLSTSFIVKENLEGSFFDTLNRDDDYSVVIDFNTNKSGVYPTKLIFSGCKFDNISYESSIGKNKTASLNFNFELDPSFGTRGIFASGNLLYTQASNNLILGTEASNNIEYELLGIDEGTEYQLSWNTQGIPL